MIRDNVIFGKENFLFLHNGAHAETSLLIGEAVPMSASVRNFRDNISARRAWCAERGIPYAHVVYPSKHLVYRDHLPDDLAGRVDGIYQRYFAGDDEILYPIDLLLEGRKQGHVFRTWDTHLNDRGALIVVQALLSKIGIEADDIHDAFEVTEDNLAGDLAKMAALSGTVPEMLLRPKFRFFISDNLRLLPRNRFHSVVVRNRHSVTESRLLVFGDSFLHMSLKLLARYFREILFVRSSSFQEDIVALYEPDAIISGNVERYLMKVDRDVDGESFLLSQLNSPDYASDGRHQLAFNAQLSHRFHRLAYDRWTPVVDALHPSAETQLVPVQDLVDTGASFRVTGNDPIFSIHGTAGQRIERFTVEFVSDVDSVAQFFFIPEGDRTFSGENSISLAVVRGFNRLQFEFGGRLVRGLRFDPLAAPGTISLRRSELVTLPG